jgi:hypothetical protein
MERGGQAARGRCSPKAADAARAEDGGHGAAHEPPRLQGPVRLDLRGAPALCPRALRVFGQTFSLASRTFAW